MSANIRYTDEPLGKLRVIADFLPTPEELVFQEEGVKVTIAMTRRSIDFFKQEAAKHKVQYHRMIRRLLDAYAERHSLTAASRSRRSPRKRAAA